jgi:hypothetical protein
MPEHRLPTRLLLPFTQGVEMEALDSAVLLAKACQATLVALALILVPAKRRRPEPRLEHVMQAKDFLEAVRWKAARHGVPIERCEVFTEDVVRSIDVLTKSLECRGMVLFVREGRGVLLSIDEIACVVEQVDCTGYIVHLEAQIRPLLYSLLKRFSWFSSRLPKRMFSPSGQPAIPQSPEQSQRPRHDESRREEVRTEDLLEDQRMHRNG